MKIEWSEVAFEDLLSIHDYIAKDAPLYAHQFIEKIMMSVEKLADFPNIGRQVPEADNPDIRELIFQSYRIMYQIDKAEERILVITVVHGSQDITNREPKPWEIF